MSKERKWFDLSRTEKLASVMYPHLCSKETQNEMEMLSKNEMRKSPMQGRREEVMKSTKAKRR
jgi:hypothetical protein